MNRPLVRRTLFILVILCSANAANAQNYVTSTGAPPFSAPEPVEYGFMDAGTGNLHLEIPMGSYPQRGSQEPITLRWVYDSNSLWNTAIVGTASTWTPDPEGGWHPSLLIGSLSAGLQDGTGCNADFTWTEPGGTQHPFPPVPYGLLGTGCPTSGHVYAADASGYELFVNASTSNNTNIESVYAPDGTMVYTNAGTKDSSGNTIISEDANGNYLANGYIDTLGRALPSGASGVTSYSVPNSAGTTSLYSFTYSQISVSTAFAQPGIAECNPSSNPNCTIKVLQSITLPDKTTFSFKYDCKASSGNTACGSPDGQVAYYGTLMSMTLPTGGQISYGWMNISDVYGNKHRYFNSRTSGGGQWVYTFGANSTCTATQVGCTATVRVSQPSGDYKVYTFFINNGTWPTNVQNYSATSGLQSTTSTTWDFSTACPWTNCHGAAYVKKLTETYTVSLPGGSSITKQTSYGYLSATIGLVTVLKEWGFYPGGVGSNPPSRTTYINYLSTGTNDIDKPTSVTICTSSGTDSACGGTGTRVSQTLTTYDSYGSSGIALISGASNHDDTNFGQSYTTRGNPTQVQTWVAGSTFLTRTYTYDTTGQITSITDPALNKTTYGYADNFFNDGGNTSTATAPSSFQAPKPTNAYLTSITYPTIPNSDTYGYYYGTGQQAVYTDVNLQSAYSHYSDPFDRITENILPIGWNWTTYTGATTADAYDAINDTSASAACSSCRHTRYSFDGLGRKVSATLTNAPEGSIETDFTYDLNSRLATQSHPHVGSSDPNNVSETFAYDNFDRTTTVTHPDGETLQTAYGTTLSNYAAVLSQQGAPSTYGYAYPILNIDESGRQREEWIDAFGRIVEVDEPAPVTTGKVLGTVTFSGTENSEGGTNCHSCGPSGGTCCTQYTIWDAGTFTVACGITENVSWGGGAPPDTPGEIATAVANAFNSATGSPCSASVSGNTVIFSATAAQSLSATTTWDTQVFAQPSFSAATSGPSLSTAGSLASSVLVTNYTYDQMGNLSKVVQGSQTRAYTYDGASRRTSMTTPEAGLDTLVYDSDSACPTPNSFSGLLVSRTDARNVRTCYQYDTLNRVKQKNYSDGTAAVNYTYDQGGAAVFALTRLTKMSDGSGSESYKYDQMGNLVKLTKIIGTQTFVISWVPNGAGEATSITYPSGRVISNNYDNVGRLSSVTDLKSGVSTTRASSYSYWPSGPVHTFAYGNGVNATYTYSPARLQLTSLAYTNGTSTLFGLNYWYQNDPTNCPSGAGLNNGQINCITDVVDSGRNVSYIYDSLLRLSSATTTGSSSFPKWGLAWNYDQYGNRTAQSVTAGSAPSSSLAFNAATNQPSGYTFDLAGNMTVEPVGSTQDNYSYDAESRLNNVSGGASATYTYDGNDLRVKKSVSGGTATVFVFAGQQDIAEYDNGAGPGNPTREYIYGNGKLLSTITGSTTVYNHEDHLSVRMTTDASGAVAGQQGHFPFGESWYSSNNTSNFVFTNYRYDSETGLDYALARYYDARMGRFCSPDPTEGQPSDPESWNRYAYARNDPINITDPSGKFFGFLIQLLTQLITYLVQSFQSFAISAFTQVGTSVTSAGTLDGTFLFTTSVTGVTSTVTFQTTIGAALFSGGLDAAAAAGGAGGVGATTANDMLHDSKERVKNDLQKRSCGSLFNNVNTASSQVDKVTFKNMGKLRFRFFSPSGDIQALPGQEMGENNIFKFPYPFSQGIHLNSEVNWVDPNHTPALLNGESWTYSALTAMAHYVGAATMTREQLMDLTILHEISHSPHVGTLNPDRQEGQQKLWDNCVK